MDKGSDPVVELEVGGGGPGGEFEFEPEPDAGGGGLVPEPEGDGLVPEFVGGPGRDELSPEPGLMLELEFDVEFVLNASVT